MFHANTRDRNINKWKIGAPDSANRYFYCLLLWFQRFSKRPNEIVSFFVCRMATESWYFCSSNMLPIDLIVVCLADGEKTFHISLDYEYLFGILDSIRLISESTTFERKNNRKN